MRRRLDTGLGATVRIRTRIYAAFAVLAVCVVVAGAFAARGLFDARNNANRFHEVNARLVSVLELDRAVIDVQRSVQVFSYTGHSSVAARARTKLTSLAAHIDHVSTMLVSVSDREILDRVRTHVETYDSTFRVAEEERQRRYQLVHATLPALDARLAAALDPDADATVTSEEQEARRVASEALSLARASVYAYLNDPDYALVENARTHLEQAADAVDPLHPSLAADLREYSRTASLIVHSTRGYLYLVGVVMAAAANELAYVSAQLKNSALDETQLILGSLDKSAERALFQGALAGGVAVLIGVFGVILLARSISGPLTEITGTLERLSRGERVGAIPGSHRSDEIGVMAVAASALRDANAKTATLLQEQRELTAELETSRSKIQKSNEELEQFVYTVSHDLKSPIVTSLGFIGMMRSLAKRGGTEAALSKLDVLERSIQRMSELTVDLLDLCRVGRVDNENSLVDTAHVLSDVLETLDRRIRESNATIHFDHDLPRVWGNPSRLMQVLENLIGNAMKYGVKPGDHPRISIKGATEPDGSARLLIRDEGPGIDPDYHERVFGLFQRLDKSRPGTGVGLSIVARVMASHGGSVTIDSDGQGNGCTFCLTFPSPTQTEALAA